MIKVKILYGEFMKTNWQDKSFQDVSSCIEWCRRNYQKIWCINNYRTMGQLISHFDIADAINGKEALI